MKNCPETNDICYNEECSTSLCTIQHDIAEDLRESKVIERILDEEACVSEEACEEVTDESSPGGPVSDSSAIEGSVDAGEGELENPISDAFEGAESPILSGTIGLEEARDRVAGLTAPKITKASIEAKISRVDYHIISETGTLCIIVMSNGFEVTGFSKPASAENYDPEVGKLYAYENAFRGLWQLEGYLLREQLSTQTGE